MRPTAAGRWGHLPAGGCNAPVPICDEPTSALDPLAEEAVYRRIQDLSPYGVLSGLGGERIEDVQVLHRAPRFPIDSPFLSTMPDSFANGHVGAFIRKSFPEPCRYELPGRR
ncbi:hypothetical protein [Streptomyces sp. NBC_01803]|uniref:hypothetical protein n=1 Tax=Streptomyces sp. NBC_01803 TaxID=2975946 RepID=UPI002DDB5215|nr:hypothetical protein [Streptomyces sp. NBC_01803]WSA44549.1 hypothetical protein OIE51_10230 [Streptomyces sp. NBC_01803]